MRQLDIFEGISDKKFPQYHKDNPHIYEMFKKFTFQMMNSGWKNLGADLIYQRMRWETMVNGCDSFKLNNNYRSLYPRLFVNEYPKHKDVFRFRKSKYDSVLEVDVNFEKIVPINDIFGRLGIILSPNDKVGVNGNEYHLG